MRLTMKATVPLLLAFSLVACGDDDPVDPGDDDLFVGSFEATSMIFTPDGGGNPINVIPLGASLTVDVESDHDFTWTLTPPLGDPEVQSGTLILGAGNTATLNFDDAEQDDITGTYAFSNNDNTLTLQSDDVSFDLNQDGEDDPASVQVVLERQ